MTSGSHLSFSSGISLGASIWGAQLEWNKKSEPTKIGGNTQIKSRSPDLGVTAGVALIHL